MTAAERFGRDDMQDEAGDQRLGFLVPVRLAGHARFVEDQGIGERRGILGDIETGRIEPIEGIEGD